MRLKIVIAIMGFVLLAGREISAQIYSYPEQAISISRIEAGGTARIRAMGGAQNALGADLSSAYYNPAGLGMYNRSEFSFSPGLTFTNTGANYLGSDTSSTKTTFVIPNFGIAFHTGKEGAKGFLGGTFAINFNRVADYNNIISYHGKNPNSSIIDYFINSANGRDSTQFGTQGINYNTPTGLAYFNYLIGPLSDFNSGGSKVLYDSPVPYQTIIQDETIRTSGSQNQWSFSYGVNFSDRIFVGAGLGLTSFTYKTSTSYSETYTQDPLKHMNLQENLDLSGTGVNFTLGVIARPVDNVQVGLSMATPNSYQINETYSASMTSNWNNYAYYPTKILKDESEQTDILTDSYSMSTPWRFSGGLAYFIQKQGFITADVEYLSYSSSKYSGKANSDQDNSDIKALYRSVLNIRVGGEYRMKNYRFRAGYSYMPDPYANQQNGVDRSVSAISGGAGYRWEKVYLDMALIFQQGNSTYNPYGGSPNVALNNKSTTIMFTVSLPF